MCENSSKITNQYFGSPGTMKTVKGKYEHSEPHYSLTVCNKELCNCLLDNFCANNKYYSATCIEKKSKLPDFPDIDCKKAFISGLFDSDGWIRQVGKDDRKYEIGFKNTSLLSREIYDLMSTVVRCRKFVSKECICRFTGRKLKPNYTWTIHPFDFFNAGLIFRVQRKQNMVLKYMENRKFFGIHRDKVIL